MTASPGLPEGFRADYIDCNGVRLHVVHNGAPFDGKTQTDGRLPLLCLHGFPDFWVSWEKLMPFISDQFFMVAPDQRGYNKSEAPSGPEHYATKILVNDMLALAQKMFGKSKFHLVGHDFGAAIAYALAITNPDRLESLIIANGAHPACYQEAILDSSAQTEASSYFHRIKPVGSGEWAAANNFQNMLDFLDHHSSSDWLTEPIRQRYRAAWQSAERLDAMFDWYRAAPIVVPKAGETITEAPLYSVPATKLRVTVPHLLIWGMKDTTLLPETRARLPEFCDDLTLKEIPEADHWVLHTHPEQVVGYMSGFLSRP